jgi:hypothetical protein
MKGKRTFWRISKYLYWLYFPVIERSAQILQRSNNSKLEHFSAGFFYLDMTYVKRIPFFDRKKHAHTGRIYKKNYQIILRTQMFFHRKIIVCHHSSLLSMYSSANVYFFYGCHKEKIFWQHVEVLFQLQQVFEWR